MTRPNKGYDKKRVRKLPEHDFLFVNQRGQPLTEWMMQSAMRRLNPEVHLPPNSTEGTDRRR